MVGHAHVQSIRVGGRVDGDRLHAELVQRADDANRDLAPVRDEDALEHQRTVEGAAVDRLELEEELAVLDRLGVADVDRADDRLDLRLHLVHQLHRLEDAERLPGRDRVALLDERCGVRRRRAVERPDHRALDAHERVVARRDRGGSPSPATAEP